VLPCVVSARLRGTVPRTTRGRARGATTCCAGVLSSLLLGNVSGGSSRPSEAKGSCASPSGKSKDAWPSRNSAARSESQVSSPRSIGPSAILADFSLSFLSSKLSHGNNFQSLLGVESELRPKLRVSWKRDVFPGSVLIRIWGGSLKYFRNQRLSRYAVSTAAPGASSRGLCLMGEFVNSQSTLPGAECA